MSGETTDAAAGGDTPEEIMEATYRALCEHGYADLTMQDIADESDKSTAALHYHYDTKEELLLSFLEYLFERFEGRIQRRLADADSDDATERLRTFVETVLTPPEEVTNHQQFRTAFLEIKAQAPYNDAYRERLQRFDEFVRERTEALVTEGIEDGTVDPDTDVTETVTLLATLINGAYTRQVGVGASVERTREAVLAYVEQSLLVADLEGAAE